MTLVTAALASVSGFFSRVSRVFLYLAVGTERLDPLREGIRSVWDDFHAAPEDVSQGLFPVERELFERWLPQGSRILFVGSGSGRDLIALAALGYRIALFDFQATWIWPLTPCCFRSQSSTEDAGRARSIRERRHLRIP